MTYYGAADPEVLLGSSGEFETYPSWVPGVDRSCPSTPIMLKTLGVDGFHHRANWPAKVRNVSNLGSWLATRRTRVGVRISGTTW